MFRNTCKPGIRTTTIIYNISTIKIIKSFLTSSTDSPTSIPKTSFTGISNSKMLSSMITENAKLLILGWPKEPEPWSQWTRNNTPLSIKRKSKNTAKVLGQKSLVPQNRHPLSPMTTEQTFIVWQWWWPSCLATTQPSTRKDSCCRTSGTKNCRNCHYPQNWNKS